MADAYFLDSKSILELRELLRRVKAMPITQFAPIVRPKTREITASQPVPILLTGTAGGGGWYTGYVLTNPVASDPTTTLQQSAFGTVPTGAPMVYIANPAEQGLASHQLAASGYLPVVFYCRRIANVLGSSGSSSSSSGSGTAQAFAIIYGEQPNFCELPSGGSGSSS